MARRYPGALSTLTDGWFALTGPIAVGNGAALGPTALIEIPPGIRVMVVSRKMQADDQAVVRHVGIEPASVPILALKSRCISARTSPPSPRTSWLPPRPARWVRIRRR